MIGSGPATACGSRCAPTRGAATQAALRPAADAFGVPRRDVTLVTGASSRDKIVEVAGPSAALAQRLGELLLGS